MAVAHLITPEHLATELRSARPPVVLDVRWALSGPTGAEQYAAGHLPGAVAIDLDRQLAGPAVGSGAGRHPLPEPGALQTVFREAGIHGTDDVVVHDTADGAIAARAWWLLRWAGHPRVRVLDGGYAAWVAGGHPVGTGAATAEPGDVVVRPGSMPVADAEAAAGATSGGILLDARTPERFRGEVEPADPAAGHVPGAVNAPAAAHLGPDGRWLTPERLRERYTALGVAPNAAVVVGCGSGVTACSVVLALELAGLTAPERPAALWPGSWSGWCELGGAVAVGD